MAAAQTQRDDAAPSDPTYSFEGIEWHNPQAPEFTSSKFSDLGNQGKTDLLLLTATPVELRQVLRLMCPRDGQQRILKVANGAETYYVGRFGAFDAVLTRSEMGSDGPAGSILTAHSAIHLWNPA